VEGIFEGLEKLEGFQRDKLSQAFLFACKFRLAIAGKL